MPRELETAAGAAAPRRAGRDGPAVTSAQARRERASRRKLDARADRLDLRDLPYRAPLVSLPPTWPPEQWIERYLPDYSRDGMVLDQREEGACTGFGLAAVINFLAWERWKRAAFEAEAARIPFRLPRPAKVSERMLYHMAQLYDEWEGEDYEGSSCRGAMKGWHKHGICSQALWPYEPGRFVEPREGWTEDAAKRPMGAYYRIDRSSLLDMQAAIREVHAIYCSAQVHPGWQRVPREGPLPLIPWDESDELGVHAFALVGYDERGFTVQNSWGERWGSGGFAVLSYDDWLANGQDAWVAVMGAPIERARPPIALCDSSLPSQVSTPRARPGVRSPSLTLSPGGRDGRGEARWSRDEAFLRTVVLDNDGAPLQRLVAAEDAASAIHMVAYRGMMKRLEEAGTRKLVIYAQAALQDEDGSLERIRALGPCFEANGIAPLFFTWKTGVLASLSAMMREWTGPLDLEGEPCRASAQPSMRHLREARDRALEVEAGRLVGKAIWTQVKQNAEAASVLRAGGARIVANVLAALAKEVRGLEIHLVGHSSGAIVLGHFLDVLGASKVEVASAELWAPACTMRFAVDRYGKAFRSGVLDPARMRVAVLGDENERSDSVGPYGKSLLYLVSRALEILKRTPLLGLATAWTRSEDPDAQLYEGSRGDVAAWTSCLGREVADIVVEESEVWDGRAWIKSTHGSFCHNVEIVTGAIERILGAPARLPRRDLHGS